MLTDMRRKKEGVHARRQTDGVIFEGSLQAIFLLSRFLGPAVQVSMSYTQEFIPEGPLQASSRYNTSGFLILAVHLSVSEQSNFCRCICAAPHMSLCQNINRTTHRQKHRHRQLTFWDKVDEVQKNTHALNRTKTLNSSQIHTHTHAHTHKHT